jgi:hypothetical protein
VIPKEVKPAKQTDANREFESPKGTLWSSFFVALIVFTTINCLELRSWC